MKRILSSSGILAAALLTGIVFFTACKKENKSNDDQLSSDAKLAITDDAQADLVYDDVFTNVMGTDNDAGIGTGIGVFGRTSGETTTGRVDGLDTTAPCFTVTRVPQAPGVFPKTITIDFGTGCTGPDGRTRKGKLVTVYTGPMIVAGSQATTTFVNYYVDSLKIEGTHIVKNNSTSSTRIFTRTVTNGKITRPSGNYVQWNATHTNTQTGGSATPFIPLDDEFDITGTATGTNYRNTHTVSWSRTITNPLHKRFICHWFNKGTVVLTINAHTATLDFGNGGCDNQATITIGGQTYPIYLPW